MFDLGKDQERFTKVVFDSVSGREFELYHRTPTTQEEVEFQRRTFRRRERRNISPEESSRADECRPPRRRGTARTLFRGAEAVFPPVHPGAEEGVREGFRAAPRYSLRQVPGERLRAFRRDPPHLVSFFPPSGPVPVPPGRPVGRGVDPPRDAKGRDRGDEGGG